MAVWTPVDARRAFFTVWTPFGLRDHIGNGRVRAFTRAVASRCDCRLLEETTIGVLIKDNPLPKANGQMPG